MEQWNFNQTLTQEQQMPHKDTNIRKSGTEQTYIRNISPNNSSDKDFEKELRRPRSKRKMNILSQLDTLSMTDEEIIQKMQTEGALDAASITKEDITAYLANIKDEFESMIQKEREAEEKRRREAIERARQEALDEKLREEQKNRTILYTLAKCYITGCTIHSITLDSIAHYKRTQIPDRVKPAFEFYKSVKKCEYVEVYPKHMAAISKTGEVLKIKEL